MNKDFKSIDSIIFDLDGTLWNPTDVILKSWQRVIEQHPGITSNINKENLESIFGVKHDLIGDILFPDIDETIVKDIMIQCFKVENSDIKIFGGNLYPNLEKILINLCEKYKLYIVSNCQKGYIEAFFSYHKLGRYFIDYECSGNTGRPKSENIKSIIDRNGINKPIYIGDTSGDHNAADNNNIPFIFAEYGFGSTTGFRYSIKNLNELLNIL